MSSMERECGEYYLGLDIGTDSVGWAVTDTEYKLQKFNGKALWGIRLFESGKTAEERRIHRSSRRRQQRRVQRIKLLQELFNEEICKVDPGFYQRLQESKFYQEDKTIEQPNAVFNDINFKDKDYHKNYPTIYHLRKALIEDEKEFDVRLLYLAIHHIIKNRGHFLFEGNSMKNISSFQHVFRDLNLYLNDELNIYFEFQDLNMVEEILKSKETWVKVKKKKLGELLNADTKQKQSIVSLLSGSVAILSDLFDDDSLDDEEINKVNFSDGKYEEIQNQLSDILEDRMYLIDKLKAIYEWAILSEICNGQKFLSYAKVSVYEKHEQDLKLLKLVVKKYCQEKYKEIFSDRTKENNYCAYVGMCKKGNKKNVIEKKKCSQEELCKNLEKILKDLSVDDPDYIYVMNEIEKRSFLPKQTTKDNGVIPYQLNSEELNVILKNASKYLLFLNNVDETGYSVKEKIKKIFEFHIPYYVGPLNDSHKKKGNCWIVKNSNEKIKPWNFENVVDIETSAENFILRMTNKCTYLIGADVLPKNSLLYSEYMVLNELNNLKINGDEITVDLKNKIFSDLFMHQKRVTNKKLRAYLLSEGVIDKQDEISGIDGDFKSSLTSYIDFKRILKDKKNIIEIIEEIIRWIVLFGDDKKLLKKRLCKVYGNELSDSEIKSILSLKYSGWGRLSREFLKEIVHVDKSTGESISIISAMRNTNNNLMRLLSGRFDFINSIEKYNAELTNQTTELTYDLVEKLYVSPAVKRSIWQTLLIVGEISKIKKQTPKKIFIEMARSEEEKKATKSRKNILLELYESCKYEERNWLDEIEAKPDSDFRSDRLYLYYTQMGRCMYTGEPIDISKLFDKNLYDVDHIYPQSKIKDDSIENRVLVKKTINAEKSDDYPISREIQNRNKGFWKSLYDKDMIGRKKYDRLVRTKEFTDDELADFISRQIVETRQSTKAVAETLKKAFENSEIVYVKAGNISDFRQQFDLIKVRDVNDYHHAKDAYLNIVVGNVYNTKFTHNPVNFIKNKKFKYNLNRMYDFDVNGKDVNAWEKGDNGTISTVKSIMKKNNILFTRYAFEQNGSLFDQMVLKKGKGQFPIKAGDSRLFDIQKYGGYNKVVGAYFMLVEHAKKKKRVRSIEFVPRYLSESLKENNEERLKYCVEQLKLVDPVILLPKIKINTLFDVDGFFMHLSGRTNNQLIFKGANQLCIGQREEIYVKKILKYIDRSKKTTNKLDITTYDGITKKENMELYDLLLNKLKNTLYNVRLSAQVKTFETGRNIFEKLSESDQCKFLGEALHLFQCNSVSSDLSLINGGKYSGIILLSNVISNYKHVTIINQSPTGIFSKEVDLLNYELESSCNFATSEA
ncbi:MAG: type II CRISPR RNA-guided endonuclease Cas9 [Sedimentibacter saalensis]|uniref:type II CRISPR RNA-guided endonuclease Cas9 n=1 Tax=Sedimentibacter saalensis TaxID=130788 RepID=UPI003158C5F3